MKKDHLVLKWGTLKDWSFHSDKALTLLKEYNKIGSSMSAMMQKDTPRQKEIICELIDEGNFKKVWLYWDGKEVTKNQAKKYVMEYGN
jgi:hypothetical protein